MHGDGFLGCSQEEYIILKEKNTEKLVKLKSNNVQR